jgi:Zn-dependent peptidase ImmA (M78 family)/DNA-binding XRE family transcriptional regulator
MVLESKIAAFPGGGRGNVAGRRLNPARLRDARVAKRLRQQELGDAVGVTRQAISAYELGEKAPEAETMARLAAALDQPLAYFTSEDLPTFGQTSTRFHRAFGAETRRRNEACEVYSKWLAQAAFYFAEKVNFPTAVVPEFEPQAKDGRYTHDELEEAADQCRSIWGLGFGPISNVLSLAENKGIAVCRLLIEDERVNAFSFWNGSRPFVFLANETESATRARFDVAHEIAHLVLQRWVEQSDIEDPKILKAIEGEANYFAGALLLPRQSFPNEVFTTRLDAFVALKQRWKVPIQAMVYRCKTLGIFGEF